MDSGTVHALVLKAAPFFASAGLPAIHPDVSEDLVKVDILAQCWGGIASILSVTVPAADSASPVNFVAKCVRYLYPRSDKQPSIGDSRKMQSYRAEAAFYQNGHVQLLLSNGCCVPRPLFVQANDSDSEFVIFMTRLRGSVASSMGRDQSRAALTWLARLHAIFWGKDRADAAVRNGLQEQGGYWYLDTRQDELAAMPRDGWQGRLRMAARAIDWRLKNDPMLTIVHGDAKSANMLFGAANGVDSEGCFCQMMDFQYMGRAAAAKDLAYALTCACDVPEEEISLLQHYHSELCSALRAQNSSSLPLYRDLEDSLALAYADLGRWMSGCSACPPPAPDSPGFDAKTGWGWWGNPLQEKIERLVLDRCVFHSLLARVPQVYADALTQA
jgi:aminoglycoside phosphotransferase (APT) family kinase protein